LQESLEPDEGLHFVPHFVQGGDVAELAVGGLAG
jgi:hypothetical protein